MILPDATTSPLWDQIHRAIIKSMAVDSCNCQFEDVVESIESGRLGVLIQQDEADLLMGMALLDLDGEWVDISFFWSAGLEHLNALFRETEELASAVGARGVKWCTENEQGRSYAERRGYRQRLVEYVKEVT